MPLIQINLVEGRTKEQKLSLLESVTRAVHESIEAPLNSIRVWIHEMPKDEFMIAGELMSQREQRVDKVESQVRRCPPT